MAADFATDFAAGLAATLADKALAAGVGVLNRWRRLSCPQGLRSIMDYEELPVVSKAMVSFAIIRMMFHRLVHPNRQRLPAS